MILVSFVQDFRTCFIGGFFIHRVGRKMASRAEVVKNLQVLHGGYSLHRIQAEAVLITVCYDG
jgi:hypothetical protein